MKTLACACLFVLMATSACHAEPIDYVYFPSYWWGNNYSFYSGGSNETHYQWHPWKARIVNQSPLAMTWDFTSPSRSANIDVLKVKTNTYQPYPGQITRWGTGNGASVKIILTNPSICQDLALHPNGGYYGYLEGGGQSTQNLWGGWDYSWLNHCLVNGVDQSSGPGWKRFGLPQYVQWGDKTHYGSSQSPYTKQQFACYLYCTTAIAVRNGVITSPNAGQNWLESQPDGYSNDVLVNPFAYQRYVNQMTTNGLIYCFRRNVPVDEANDRDLSVSCSVHSSGHWVIPPARKVKDENSAVYHQIVDSMFSVRHIETLEDYWGYSLTNTRCWYWKNSWYRAMLMSQASWGSSGITAATRSAVNVSLLDFSGATIETAIQEYLEDATLANSAAASSTGSSTTSGAKVQEEPANALVDCGKRLIAEDIPSGIYTLRITGDPATTYSVSLSNYDEKANTLYFDQWGYPQYVKLLTGTIGESGIVDFPVPHLIGTTLGDVIYPDLADGTRLTYSDISGVITLVIPGVGCYVQSPTDRGKKPIFIHTAWPTLRFGQKIANLRGKVGTFNGEKCLEVTAGDYIDNQDVVPVVLPRPVGASPELVGGLRGTGHRLTRTFGRVTEQGTGYLILNGRFKVWASNSIPIGAFISAEIVEHGGEFYLVAPESIVRLQ